MPQPFIVINIPSWVPANIWSFLSGKPIHVGQSNFFKDSFVGLTKTSDQTLEGKQGHLSIVTYNIVTVGLFRFLYTRFAVRKANRA